MLTYHGGMIPKQTVKVQVQVMEFTYGIYHIFKVHKPHTPPELPDGRPIVRAAAQ